MEELKKRSGAPLTEVEVQNALLQSQLSIPNYLEELCTILESVNSNLNILARFMACYGKKEGYFSPEDYKHIEVEDNEIESD